jgi:RNA-directed DNA polymerase
LPKIRHKEHGLVGISKDREANKKVGITLKRYGYIYEKIYDIENIKNAIYKASLGKRDQLRVRTILENSDRYARYIRKMLIDQTYRPTKPHIKTIQDGASGKTRTIHKPNFYPDQIIHWALMLQLEPILMKSMYQYNCGSVPGRGTSYGQKALRNWLDRDAKNTKYCLKMDVKKFYPSIKSDQLKKTFRKKIKDEKCLWLIDTIIGNEDGQPIGFYTSQWFANFFLQDMDHFIKETLGVKCYIRYVDDLVLLGPNKKKLHAARKEVESFLARIGLTLKSTWQVWPIKKRDIDFLGIRFYRTKTTLRKRNALRIRRRVRRIRRKGRLNEQDASAVVSYWGWIKRSNSFYFYHKYMQPFVTINMARKVVSVNGKLRKTGKRHYAMRLNPVRGIQANPI